MNLFTDHPSEHGLTYWQHLKFALWGGVKMTFAGLACIVHAFCPFLFKWTASKTAYENGDQLDRRDNEALDQLDDM